MGESLKGLGGRQIAMNGEEEKGQQRHQGGLTLSLESETRTTVVPRAKRAKSGGRSTERWREEQADLSPALRPSWGAQMAMTQLWCHILNYPVVLSTCMCSSLNAHSGGSTPVSGWDLLRMLKLTR